MSGDKDWEKHWRRFKTGLAVILILSCVVSVITGVLYGVGLIFEMYPVLMKRILLILGGVVLIYGLGFIEEGE